MQHRFKYVLEPHFDNDNRPINQLRYHIENIRTGEVVKTNLTQDEMIEALVEVELAFERKQLRQWLQDPETVLVWMLRRTIAVPSYKAMTDRFWDGQYAIPEKENG